MGPGVISSSGSFYPSGANERVEPRPPDVHKPADAPGQQGKGKDEGNSDPGLCGTVTANPVAIASGEKLKTETDFSSLGNYGISLVRTYRSKQAEGNLFGRNWHSSLDYPALLFSGCYKDPELPGCQGPTSLTFIDQDGARFIYRGNQFSGFTLDGNAAGGSISGSESRGWTLYRGNRRYAYSAAGVIQTIADEAGVVLLYFQHNGSQQLESVTDAAGRSVILTRTNGRVTAVTDPAGQVWTYGYDGNGMLTSVTSPGASPDIRSYHYESSVAWWLLTGITINGTRYSTYSYYADQRVKESGLAGGEERDTFAYGSNQTTVTSAAGLATTHQFTLIGTSLRPISVSRAATGRPSCVSGPSGRCRPTGRSRPPSPSPATAPPSIRTISGAHRRA